MINQDFYRTAHILLATLLYLPLAAFGEETKSNDGQEMLTARSRWKEYVRKHFEIHGYLTTAFVAVRNAQGEDQPRSTDQFLRGLREGEAFDHRIAALQLRYDPKPRHSFLLQWSHRKLADSSITDLEEDIVLDWLFYRFQPRANLEVSLGRFPVSNGLHNKIRDVGLLLPFFSPPYNFYRDGDFISETIDGIGLTYRHSWSSGWDLTVEGYTGRHKLLEGAGVVPVPEVREVQVESDTGVQLWLRPPIPGLVLGLGGQIFRLEAGSTFNEGPATWKTGFFSAQYVWREKLTLRGEFRRLDFPIDVGSVRDNETQVDFSYLQIGYQWTRRIGLWGQMEWGQGDQEGAFVPQPHITFRVRNDRAVSVVYALSKHFRWKAELHQETFDVAEELPPPVGSTQVGARFSRHRTNYLIVTFSAGF